MKRLCIMLGFLAVSGHEAMNAKQRSLGYDENDAHVDDEIDAALRDIDRNEENRESKAPWPKPDDWETYDYWEMREHFKCSEYTLDQTRPLPSIRDWRVFRNVYKEVVDGRATFEDPVPPTMGYTLGDGPTPYYAGHSTEGRGRGLFASRDIKQGELVHDGTRGDVPFPDSMSWRRYIFSLPRKRACDQMDWSWIEREEDGSVRVKTAMNISILMNGGESEDKNNLGPGSAMTALYALRDISQGEELLYDYSIYDTTWDDVGL